MVLAPFGPAVTVDPSGANQQSGMQNPPSAQGGTVIESQSNGDLDSNVQLQGPAVQTNPWQEFQGFVAELGRIYSATTGTAIAPAAVVTRIEDMCQAWRQQTYHA